MEKLRQKILAFIYAPKDTPLLAGFVVGLYMLLYYYSKNYNLANSWLRLAVFTVYFVLVPVAIIFLGYTFFGVIKKGKWQKQFLFIAVPSIMAFYLLQLSWMGEVKRLVFAGFFLVVVLLSFWLKRFYKAFILIIAFMALFNLPPLFNVVYMQFTMDTGWKQQPDDIGAAVFKSKPNIYYLQPDGYTSFTNMRNSPYSYDNSSFEDYLKGAGFTLYNNYRSNYYSTLLSNSSMFSMKHHYINDTEDIAARHIIMGDNPVIQILKNNGYKLHFISDKPYLIVNRPAICYDDVNFNGLKVLFSRDGWNIDANPSIDFLKAINNNKGDGHFYFIERMLPSHITPFEMYSTGVDGEKKTYFERLQQSNNWIRTTISRIERHDPDALIIIAADHGGFVGYSYNGESDYKTNNPLLVKSVFGAMLAIKWNNPDFAEYDKGLKTSVNLFRTVFAFLAEDKKYLDNLQENSSYIMMQEPKGLYRNIDENGNVVLQKKE